MIWIVTSQLAQNLMYQQGKSHSGSFKNFNYHAQFLDHHKTDVIESTVHRGFIAILTTYRHLGVLKSLALHFQVSSPLLGPNRLENPYIIIPYVESHINFHRWAPDMASGNTAIPTLLTKC